MATNLRILYNNVADLATITASTTASGFAASNLQNAQKTSVHRSTGSTVTYTVTWTSDQTINGIALPATNLTGSSDTIAVTLYNSSSGVIASSGTLTACSGRSTLLQSGATTTDYTQFAFGGATKTSIWFTTTYTTVRSLTITLTSSTVSQIDCARIVCGQYWEPGRQVDKGIELGFTDQSDIITTRSGNTYVDRKPITETMSFQLQYLSDTDRQQFMKIMRAWGVGGLIYICVFPDNSNPELTQAYSIYGRNQTNTLQYQVYNFYSSSPQITSW